MEIQGGARDESSFISNIIYQSHEISIAHFNSSTSIVWKNKWVTNWRIIHDTSLGGKCLRYGRQGKTYNEQRSAVVLLFHETKSIVTVWAAISSHGLIGPFEEIVNSERYLSMLRNNFIPQLLATALPFNTQWFMQDGARPHTANIVLDFLHEIFGTRVISLRFPGRFNGGQFWPPNSPDLNPCDFFLWGSLKEKIFPKRPRDLMELRRLILQACSEIKEDMCRRVIANISVRLDEVINQNGGHIEHVLS